MKFGPYYIRGTLGEGGMGVVHRAQDAAGREFALKVIKKELGSDPEIHQRFRREIRLCKRLSHPHIVRTYDAGEIDGTLYLASELVRGGSLARVLARRGALTEVEALWITRDLLCALDAVAAAGMLHRDVKPDNILLDLDGIAKLSDLGLARTSEADRTRYTADGQILGTPEYLAPEQFDGDQALDPRCDLYAAGCVLFECLAGRAPFVEERFFDLLLAKLSKPAPDVRTLAPRTRAEVAELVRKLLEKDRARRPASVAEALAAVERLLLGCPARAPLLPSEQATADAARQALSCKETMVLNPPAGPRADVVAGLPRAKLVTHGPGGERTLFLYTGTRLRIGRDGIDRGEVDLCLRLRPSAGNEAGTRAISGKHLRITVAEQRASVTDTASALGTALDGCRLTADTSEPLPERCELYIASALRLLVRVIRPLPAAPVAGEPSVVIERISNGTEHSYALIPERLWLARSADDALLAGDAGEVEIAVRDVGLELRVPGGVFAPLVAGMSFQLGGLPVTVGELRPEDQK